MSRRMDQEGHAGIVPFSSGLYDSQVWKTVPGSRNRRAEGRSAFTAVGREWWAKQASEAIVSYWWGGRAGPWASEEQALSGSQAAGLEMQS